MRTIKERVEQTAGDFIEHIPCFNPECGSSDGNAVYHEEERGYNSFCWVCKRVETLDHIEGQYLPSEPEVEEIPELSKLSIDEVLALPFKGWKDRVLYKSVHRLFGVHANGEGSQINEYYYPTYRDGEHVGYKIRSRFKADDPQVIKGKVKEGTFKCFKGYVGDNKKGIQLFGQQLYDTAPRRVFILGGQEDCMAAYQAVEDSINIPTKRGENVPGYAFVSPQNGENDTDIKKQLEWFDTAKEIYLCFDEDEAGHEATEKVAKLFDPSKIRIMSLKALGVNDTSDAVKEGKSKEWWHCIWSAQPYSPAGIVSFSGAIDAMKNRGDWDLIPFPDSFGDLNERTLGGYALGEIVNIIAPTSIGKSIFSNEMVFKAIQETDYNIGVLTLEADMVEYAEQLLSLALDYRIIEVPHDKRDWDTIEAAHNSLFDGRIYLIEDMGAIGTAERFWDKVNYLVSGLNCKIIIFDPATLGVRAARMDEEDFNADLVTYVKRKKIAWVDVCHTRKTGNDQKAGSEGKEMSEEDLKGSGAWIQNAMINLVLSRDKLNEDEEIKNTTQIKVTKVRRNGKGTGVAGYALYDGNTGRLVQGRNPELLGD